MRDELVTLAIALAAYLGYYQAPQGQEAWVYYIMGGVLAFRLAQLQRPKAETRVGIFAYTFIMIESCQQAVCGSLHIGFRATKDVCVDLVGDDIYRAGASLSLAALWMVLFYSKHRRLY